MTLKQSNNLCQCTLPIPPRSGMLAVRIDLLAATRGMAQPPLQRRVRLLRSKFFDFQPTPLNVCIQFTLILIVVGQRCVNLCQ
jgi:hypothetical protein